jgi:hypothetical protein
MQETDCEKIVFASSPNRFAFVARNFYCAESLLPASAFALAEDDISLHRANLNLLLGEPEAPRCVCQFEPGKHFAVFGTCLANNTLQCVAEKHAIVLRSSFDLPCSPLVVSNLSKDGQLTCFTQVQRAKL